MFHEAIYYPHIEIRDPSWLRSSLLLWDKIKTIVPDEHEGGYFNTDMRHCYDERMIEEIRIRNHPQCIENASNFMIENWEQISKNIRNNSNYGFRRHYSGSDNYFIHPSKLSIKLSEKFRETFYEFKDQAEAEVQNRNSYYRDDRDSDWIAVDNDFSIAYMSLLADDISQSTKSHAITEYHGFKPPYANTYPNHASDFRSNKLIDIIIENTIIDPDVDIRKIIKFRKERRDQLDALHGYIYSMKELIEKDSYIEDAKRVYETKIKPEINAIRGELDSYTIGWMSGGLLSFCAAPDMSSAIADMFSVSPVTALSATAGIILVGSIGFPMRQRVIKKNTHSLAYLMNVNTRFSIDEAQHQVMRQIENEKRYM